MRDSSSAGAAPNGRWAVGTTSLEGTVSTFPARVGSALTVAGALTLNDSLRVNNAMNVSGTLNLNGRRLQASSFETLGTGLVQMTNSGNADTLLVNGLASWHGGTPNITNGVTVFNGSFSQAPGSAANTNTFSPTGAHKTLFMRASLIDSTVTFTNPTASFFNNVELRANIALGSDVTLNGTLTRTAATPAAMVVAGSAAQVLTTAGIIGDGIYPINFSNARLKFVDGTSDATPRNLTFINFASGYAGIIFEVSRSTATVLNSVTFSGLSLSGGSYVKNTGSGTVTFSGSGTCTTTLTPGLSCP